MIVAGMVKLVKFISKHDTFKRLAVSERNNYTLYTIKAIVVPKCNDIFFTLLKISSAVSHLSKLQKTILVISS